MQKYLLAFSLIILTVSSVYCLYEESCKENQIFKPYMKIYEGRADSDDPLEWGTELPQQGPGLHDTEELTNVYVCLNGPAWLYFERKTVHGVVYDKPVFKEYHHECQFFNGDKGPGSTDDKITLQAILLMGDDEDYRKPFMQLFTAPFYNDSLKIYENVTSLMTFGQSVCTLNRGSGQSRVGIPVISQPEEKYSHCRLSYKNIDLVLPEKDKVEGDKIKEALRNDVQLSKGECVDLNAPGAQAGTENHTVFNISAFTEIDNQRYGAVLKKWEDLKAETAKSPPDGPGPISADIATINGVIDPITANPAATPDDIETKRIKEYEKATRLIYDEIEKLLPGDEIEEIKTIKGSTLLDKTELKEALDGFVKLTDGLKEAEGKLETCVKDAACTDQTTLEGTVKDEKKKIEDAVKEIEDAAKTIKPLIAQAKSKIVRLEILLAEVGKAYADWSQAAAKTLTANYGGDFTRKSIATVIEMPVKNTTTDPASPVAYDNVKKCEKFATADEVCKGNRPGKIRACQLLKAAMGNPQHCATPETIDPTTGAAVPVVPKLSDLLDDTIKDVFTLIEEIFTRACPQKHFFGNLAKMINYIFQCYIVKLKEDNGAGFKVKPSTKPRDPQDVEAHKFWVHVKEALRDCKKHGRTLNFTEDVVGSGNYKFYALKKDGTYEERPVEHLKEQADKEYAFNFAMDMHYRIFVTVMGLCMPSYEMKIPLITNMFYAKYTETFFHPLRMTWTDPKDNQMLKVYLGNFYNGNTFHWATQCMEASFVQSEEKSYRPPRDLPVNGGIEQNFFISGPLAHSSRNKRQVS